MSFEILEKSPQVAPLLVRLYDTHNLYSLAGDKESTDARFELATIMVDLMSVKLSDTESELITDVLFALTKQAEVELKQALAESLSTLDGIPLRMILALANDEISVAEPILRSSPVLQDMDLIYILQAKGASHGRAIARREGLSATLVNMLVETKDFEIGVNLSNNDGIRLTNYAYGILGEMAKKEGLIAAPLLHRDDLPQDVAAKLYEFVGEELKKEINIRFGEQAEAASAAINRIATEVKASADLRQLENLDMLMAQAHVLHQRGELKIAGVISSLRRGQPVTFMAQFATFCSLPMDMVRNMLKQESGRGLAIACRAYDIGKADFISIYLLTERLRNNAKRVISHNELSRLMTMYDDIAPEEARRAIQSSRH